MYSEYQIIFEENLMDNLLLTCLAVNFLSFCAGTALSWSSPMVIILYKNGTDNPLQSSITPEEDSWLSALLCLGAAFGPFLFGSLTNEIGLKHTLLLTGIPLLIGYLLMLFAKSLIVLYIARLLSGLTLGGTCNLVSVYIGEIACTYNRGALSSLFNLFLCAGMLFSYCLGPYVSFMLFNFILSIFTLFFLIAFLIVGSESPYFYIKHGEVDRARKVLQKLRGPLVNVEDELRDIHKHLDETANVSIIELFTSKALRKAFIIALGLMFFFQFSGNVPIFSYTEIIFQLAEANLNPAISSIIVGIVQFLTTITTPFTVEKLGRKILLQISALGMAISEGTLGAYCYLKDSNYDVSNLKDLPIICLMVYTFSFNFGYGTLPWLMLGELFPSKVKPLCTLFMTSFSWSLSFLIVKYFQIVVTNLGMGVAFWIFTISCVISIPFNHFVVIETKGRSLQQIKTELSY